MGDADIVVTCDPNSSTIIPTILAEKPIVMIPYRPLTPDVLEQEVNDRIETMDLFHDEHNRLQINWSDLDAALENARAKAQSRSLHTLYLS